MFALVVKLHTMYQTNQCLVLTLDWCQCSMTQHWILEHKCAELEIMITACNDTKKSTLTVLSTP